MLNSSWFSARRLQTQLLLWTAIILIVSVVVALEVRIRWNVELLESNLRDRSETMIKAVDTALGLSEAPQRGIPDTDVLERKLNEFVSADPTLDRLDIVQQRGSELVIVASTTESPELLVQSIPMLPQTTERTIGSDRALITAQAVKGTNFGIVAVASTANIDRFQVFNRGQVPAFAAVLFLIVITLMHVMYKRTVSKRFDELLDGIQRAKQGEAAAIPESRADEIGIIAKTLNGLIAQVQSFNDELKSQVASATRDLNQRNIALETTTKQMVEMQQQLLQSERLAAVGQMAATFAHEIGSPMTSLSAHVQLLLEDSRLTPDQAETLAIVRQQIQAVVQIVNEMLRSARRGPSDFVLTDINDILRTVVRLVEPRLTSQKIAAAVTLENIPLVRGYPLYLQEAFLNLINNATDAMPAGGSLNVRSWFDADSQLVNIRIEDTGPGIDESVVEKMFHQFVTTKAIGSGTGLGLGIVKEIVDSHRGSLRITAAAGRGTAAHITFPVETTAVLAS